MATFEIVLPDESPCEECGDAVPAGVYTCASCGANAYRLNFPEFYSHFERLKMMDARYGGLILGRSDSADDVPMYVCRDGGVYTLVGLMQGGEYIMSRAATIKYGARLVDINSVKGEATGIQFPLSPMSSVINTNFMPMYGGIWITEGQFVVNRYATKIHFEELEQLNSEANLELASQFSNEAEQEANDS